MTFVTFYNLIIRLNVMLNIKDVAENDNVVNEITKSNRSLVPD